MDKIFHEKQEGYLCAQHCLNALLQGPYFNAVDLANLAHQMDEEERLRMAESGVDSEDYRQFLEQPSGNVDDSGYFSVQVINSALDFWGLDLIPYNSTEPTALMAQSDPAQMKAYICNYRDHWFTIRKLGTQWFNLNSLMNGPQLITNTYLAMFLAQLIQEGYSIFIVIGNFPPCEADEYLLRYPEKQRQNSENSKVNKNLENKLDNEAKLLKTALEGIGEVKVPSSSLNSASCSTSGSSNNRNSQIFTKSETEKSAKLERIIPVITLEGSEQEDDEDAELQRALQLSLEDANDDVKNPLALRLDLASDENATRLLEEAENDDDEEDDELRRALQLSLEGFSSPTTTTATSDQDEVRWRHLPILSMSRTNTESTQKLNT
ncbi:ataxin-3-like [Leptopilina heterotoma]|uniref:ataxin-3-like n=1 Tax=Leptopilina heterotoma TaxID=63436 RepID=UPI001CA85C15|nr:ataxin-3-like [Leptopilina heterotoma]